MGRVQVRKQPKPRRALDAPKETEADAKESLKDDMDEILDEIDAVLETNAEEFVKGYIQRGGE